MAYSSWTTNESRNLLIDMDIIKFAQKPFTLHRKCLKFAADRQVFSEIGE